MKTKNQISALFLGTALAFAPAFAWSQPSQTADTSGHDHQTDSQSGESHGSAAKRDMKNAGHETRDAAKDAGRGTKEGTEKGYDSTKHGTEKAYHATKHGTKKAWHKTKDTTKGAVEGGKEGAHQPE